MNIKRIKIVTTVPPKNADALRKALGDAGAGVVGDYSYCSFTVVGKGRFKAGKNADPHIGEPGKSQIVEEEQIEVVCDISVAKQVVRALKVAHPYEEPIVDVTPLLSEADLQ